MVYLGTYNQTISHPSHGLGHEAEDSRRLESSKPTGETTPANRKTVTKEKGEGKATVQITRASWEEGKQAEGGNIFV